ncbi:hypothetical protein T492DRAFT_134664 [Pavlovales sp. CCMP2436]|nr:hypothetical protein T492DRAFT_134664 [Pavlovales sp. CCMP2436]
MAPKPRCPRRAASVAKKAKPAGKGKAATTDGGKLVQQIVSTPPSAEHALEPSLLAQLKAFARQSHGNVDGVFAALVDALNGASAAARCLAVEACDVLWARSARFRTALTEILPAFVEATVTAIPTTLRPPSTVRQLQHIALRCVGAWTASHGAAYPQLALAERYVREACGFAIPAADGRLPERQPSAAEALRDAERGRLLLARFDALGAEVAELGPQLEAVLDSMANAFEILVPNLDGAAEGAHGPAPRVEGARGHRARGGRARGDSGHRAKAAPGAAVEGEANAVGRKRARGDGSGSEPEAPESSSEPEDAESGSDVDSDEFESALTGRGGGTGWRESGAVELAALGITTGTHEVRLDLGLPDAMQVLHARRENSAVADALADSLREIRIRFLPAVQRWLATLARVSIILGDAERARSKPVLLDRAGGLLERMQRAQAGCVQLGVGDDGGGGEGGGSGRGEVGSSSTLPLPDFPSEPDSDDFEEEEPVGVAPPLFNLLDRQWPAGSAGREREGLGDSILAGWGQGGGGGGGLLGPAGPGAGSRDSAFGPAERGASLGARLPIETVAVPPLGLDGKRQCALPRRDGSPCPVRAAPGERCPTHGALDLALRPGENPLDPRARYVHLVGGEGGEGGAVAQPAEAPTAVTAVTAVTATVAAAPRALAASAAAAGPSMPSVPPLPPPPPPRLPAPGARGPPSARGRLEAKVRGRGRGGARAGGRSYF